MRPTRSRATRGLDHGAGALRGRRGFGERVARQSHARSRRALRHHDEGLTRCVQDFYSCRLGDDGRPDSPLGSHVKCTPRAGSRRAAISASWSCNTSICRCRRAARRLLERRGLRGAAGQRLAPALVAGRGLGAGGADHDRQRPPDRPAHDHAAGGRRPVVRAASPAQRLRSDRLRRPRSRGVRVGHRRDGAAPGDGRRPRAGRQRALSGGAAVWRGRRAQGRGVLWRGDESRPQPAAGRQPAHGSDGGHPLQ